TTRQPQWPQNRPRWLSLADKVVDALQFSLKRVINLDDLTLEQLSELGDLDKDALEEMLSWTGKAVGNVRMVFRGEVFVSRALRNPKIRCCPHCLREDAMSNTGSPLSSMVMRGDWQLRAVSYCLRHNRPLVPLWERNSPTERYDIGARLGERMGAILNGHLDAPQRLPSPHDLWLDERLESGKDLTWLHNQTLHAATTFCGLLGTELLRLQKSPLVDEAEFNSTAQAAGFDVAARGPEAIREALDQLAARASGHNDEPKKAFGNLYATMSRAYLHEPDFAVFRDILRECILDIWPVPAGTLVLGTILPERRLHSVSLAAHEVGIGTTLMEQFLVHARAISADDGRPQARKTFDPSRYADLLTEIPTLVGPIEMQALMGATRVEFRTLAQDNVLIPRIDIPSVKFPWRPSDGVDLVAMLFKQAVMLNSIQTGWESLQRARLRAGVSLSTIVGAIRDGQVQVGHVRGRGGYRDLLVLKVEIDRLAGAMEDGQGPKPLLPEDVITTAAAFGRSVGIRDGGRFAAFVAAGHVPALQLPHPKIGGLHYFMSKANIAAFHERFLTLTTMTQEFGSHPQTLLAKVKAAGVKPFAPKGEEYGFLYLRIDIETALD
ncbi:TniQ family protein, partial [Pseudorhodobacter sp. W20_MBD10_FR17]|uniref:TniQ family protein n=1 Tax=Pseudorhodobacter sp. W20_MBD10_FR17 TaxID=3240266 RepID=UPI003F9D12B2